jgi:ketosteroid isomerase-like protein
MSQENVEIVRTVIAATRQAMANGDPAAAFPPEFAADFEWILPVPFEGKTMWTGIEECVEFLRLWGEQFEDYSFQATRLIDVGDHRVVALERQAATGRESGVRVEWANGVVYELIDGRIVRATNYLTHADALEAAGLSE